MLRCTPLLLRAALRPLLLRETLVTEALLTEPLLPESLLPESLLAESLLAKALLGLVTWTAGAAPLRLTALLRVRLGLVPRLLTHGRTLTSPGAKDAHRGF